MILSDNKTNRRIPEQSENNLPLGRPKIQKQTQRKTQTQEIRYSYVNHLMHTQIINTFSSSS